MSIGTTKFVRYSVLPGLWPRIRELFGSGFSSMAGIMAVVYFNLKLLPPEHPYLNPVNIGRFGVRHVIAAAGKNLTFSWRHSDQVLLYFSILAGLVILILQMVLIVSSLFFYAPAFAADSFLGDYSSDLGSAFGSGVGGLVDAFFGSSGAASATNNWIAFSGTAAGPSQDIAFVVLDQIFGVLKNSGASTVGDGFFGSCISTSVDCTDIHGTVVTKGVFPSAMHAAMHKMFWFYTMGIGFLSGAVLLYYVVTIVGETVVTGTPFGQRFNKAWAIPRMIMFFALLAPISISGNNSGINVGQLITLSVAKFGSNFASNGWLLFVEGGVNEADKKYSEFFGKGQDMLGMPKIPELGTLTQYMYIVRMCMFAQKIVHNKDIVPYVVRAPSENTTLVTLQDGSEVAYNAMGGTTDNYLPYFDYDTQANIPFYKAVEFSHYKDVTLRFGHYNPPGGPEGLSSDLSTYNPDGVYDQEWGYVEPTCGDLQFEITSLDLHVIGDSDIGNSIQGMYWYFMDVFLYLDETFAQTTYCMLQSVLPYAQDSSCAEKPVDSDPGVVKLLMADSVYETEFPLEDAQNKTRWLTHDNAKTSKLVIDEWLRFSLMGQKASWNSVSEFNEVAGYTSIYEYAKTDLDDETFATSLVMSDEVKERGWVGASLWYNRLAEINGIYATAVQNAPRPFKYPLLMETIAAQHIANDTNPQYSQRFNPQLANGKMAKLPKPIDQNVAAVLYSVYEFWNESAAQESVYSKGNGNKILDIINMILGTNGVFDILENRGVYPLAMLSSLGKSMVDASLRNLWIGVVGQGLGELLEGVPSLGPVAGISKVLSQFAFKFGMIGLGIGFILYYVLPVLPFVYFFFGFGGWIKSIFEAFVAMPLWALAHLKIDGEGLPGPWATNGYFLLLEIFLRPILIVFGFVFSISLFAALINALHDSYFTVVMVATGFDYQAELNGSNSKALLDFTDVDQMEFMRGPVDEVFYTIVYVIMVYMVGLSCFKLVDTIPNNLIRWMGVTVSTFQENSGDPAGQMTSRVFRSIQITNIQLVGLINKAQGFRTTDTASDMAIAGAM